MPTRQWTRGKPSQCFKMDTGKFFILATGLFSGIAWRSFYDWGPALAGFFILLGLVFLITRNKIFIFISLFLLGFGIGHLRYDMTTVSSNNLESQISQRTIITGTISEEPEQKDNYLRFILNSNGNRILVYADKYPEYKYGDKIKMNGILNKPENFSSFDWQSYLEKDDIYYEMFYPKIEFIGHNGSWIKSWLFGIKQNFLSAIQKAVPEPNASYLGGVTIGAKTTIPAELQNDFKKTGVIHIIVLSGYNITVVARSMMAAVSFLPQMFGVGLGILGIILFTIMTGATATAVRASIMAILAISAKFFSRIYAISWALLLAGVFMVMQNPRILRFDSSFQLSFLATIGLIYMAPILEKKLQFIPQKFGLREIITTTSSAQIMVLPILLYKTGLFSVYALPANILILSFMPLTMFLGFITGGLGMISFILATPLGWLSYAVTQYELGVVNFFAGLPFSSFTISNFPAILALLIYIIYGWFIIKNIVKEKL
ncbi:MAG: hypothetical protein Athens071426_657 [Parcubacteria group bacterium Athens0714_26]|nr:MAG: hypothetical protein Athens071426_657 [Parcubacteria group bacterium Athens0714_26]